jgi:sulfur-carrier protein
MKIQAQFFAQLRDVTGTSEKTIELVEGATVADLLANLYERTPALRRWDRNILLGSGVDFVDREHVLQPDETIAIMPPVQGG